jgi:hypothetical protein
MTAVLGIMLEIVLALCFYLITVPLHEYGHKFALRILGFDSRIIWHYKVNENDGWFDRRPACIPEESLYDYDGTLLDFIFITGSGGAVQSLALVLPILFLQTFGVYALVFFFSLSYMCWEIITNYRAIE